MANALRAAIHPFPGQNASANAPQSGFSDGDRARCSANTAGCSKLQQPRIAAPLSITSPYTPQCQS
jgi:hypothetical protein